MKICISCKKEKELDCFYKHKQMKDGHLNKCKECCKTQSWERQKEKRKNNDWLESEKERGRKRYYRLGYKNKYTPKPEKRKDVYKKYKQKYPEKHKAKQASNNIISPNGLVKHHWSYKSEHYKDVIFLKPKDHYKLHRYLKYDEREFQFIDKEGILLDSKTKHLEYLTKLKINYATRQTGL